MNFIRARGEEQKKIRIQQIVDAAESDLLANRQEVKFFPPELVQLLSLQGRYLPYPSAAGYMVYGRRCGKYFFREGDRP